MPGLHKSPHSPEFLARIAGEVRAAKHVKHVYLYFNNGIGAVGVENTRHLQKLLAP